MESNATGGCSPYALAPPCRRASRRCCRARRSPSSCPRVRVRERGRALVAAARHVDLGRGVDDRVLGRDEQLVDLRVVVSECVSVAVPASRSVPPAVSTLSEIVRYAVPSRSTLPVATILPNVAVLDVNRTLPPTVALRDVARAARERQVLVHAERADRERAVRAREPGRARRRHDEASSRERVREAGRRAPAADDLLRLELHVATVTAVASGGPSGRPSTRR